MKLVICTHDGLECDLDTGEKTCRHLPFRINEFTHQSEPTWNGRCTFRIEKQVVEASVEGSSDQSKEAEEKVMVVLQGPSEDGCWDCEYQFQGYCPVQHRLVKSMEICGIHVKRKLIEGD
jgi:hypothetical protein